MLKGLVRTGRNQLPNASAGHGRTPETHLGIDHHLKSEFPAKLRQHGNIARRPVSEMKVVAFVDFHGVEAVAEDLLREVARTHKR